MKKKNILVVDDEPQIVEVLERFLSMQNFNVKTALDGHRGLDILLKSRSLDLLILDEKMPEMKGEDFLKEMERLKIEVPVIVLTGSLSIAQLDPARRKRYKHILIKPVRLTELLELINTLMDNGKTVKKGVS